MEEDKSILIILKLLALCYPILQSWGFFIELPLVVILQNGTFADFVKQISIFEECVVTCLSKKGQLKKYVETVFSEPILICYDDSFKAQTLVRQISTIVKTGFVGESKAIGMPIIVAEDMIPINVLSNAFYIHYDTKNGVTIPYDLIRPDVFDLSRIQEKIEEKIIEFRGNEKVLAAAACFAYPRYDHEQIDALIETVKNFAEKNRQMQDLDGVTDMFISELYIWHKKVERNVLWQLPNIPSSVQKQIDEYIFYNNKHIFMSNELFKNIVEPFRNMWGVNTIKKALAEDGLLICGAGKTYTSKMNFWTEFGVVQRLDMLRFDIERLDRPGELDFLTVFEGGDF